MYGEGSSVRAAWVKQQQALLWDGKSAEVLAALQSHAHKEGGVAEAISYYTSHQDRMRYAEYRARGLQIGSGTMERGCNQLVSARIKLAGMIWNADGAEAVAVVRAWLLSERWDEAMRLRPIPKRSYQRRPPPALAA
jgi:hypothetical protein